MAVLDLSKKPGRVTFIRGLSDVHIGTQVFLDEDLNPSLVRFNSFWNFMETIQVHGYVRAAMSVIGRSAVGTWFKLRKHEEYEKQAREIQRKRLYSFYMMHENRAWDNIKDYYSFAYKMMISIMYLRYFGQTAFEIVRNDAGIAIGLDFLPGLIIPNVKEDGKFKRPAFVQYPTNDPAYKIEFNDPRDVVFITTPDWEGCPLGASDIEALATYALPLDLYLQATASGYMQNRNKPEGFFVVSPDIDDDAYDAFVQEIEERYSGPTNAGRSPVVVQGELKYQDVSPMPSDLPYQEARATTREEILAVSGTSGAKLGLTEDMSNANLREMRRENHETTMIPIFKVMELGFYEQVHVREFNVLGWEFRFNYPDFLNAVERATVDMRHYQMGAKNPNEIRYGLGYAPREDELGDLYYDQLVEQRSMVQPGSPPEGRPPQPDDPAQVGEPNTDTDDPVRGDQHDDTTREDSRFLNEQDLLDALYRWRSFAVRRVKKGRGLRLFQDDAIPPEIGQMIQTCLDNVDTVEGVLDIFDEAIAGVIGDG